VIAALLVGCGAPSSVAPDAIVPDGPDTACPAEQWCVEDSPVTATLLHAVWATSAQDVFAVGDRGTILHRQRGAWTTMASGTTANLRGVWGASASEVWAVGEAGTVLRYDGVRWTALAGIAIDLHAVWGTGPSDVFLVGPGRVFQWDGVAFASRPLAGEPLAIHGTGPADVWITGESSRVSHYDGTWTTGIDPGAGSTYFAVVAAASDDVWVSTFVPGAEMFQFDGARWTPHATGGGVFQGLHAIASDDVWGAGGSSVGHWDGTGWQVERPAGPAQLWGVHGAGSALWIVGSDSLILHRSRGAALP
jgi:hypothetical protein